MSDYSKLIIDENNICELNHFIYTHSLKTKSLGKPYTAYTFHSEETLADSNSWLYKINKYGYRGKDWSFKRESIAFFGCSFTFGIGVEKDVTNYVEESLGIPCHNIGQPGASSLNILKTFTAFSKFHPVNTAVITLPQVERLYWPSFNDRFNIWNYANIIPHWVDDSNRKIHKYAYKFFNFDACVAYMYDYIQMVELSAQLTNTNIIWSSWDQKTDEVLRAMLPDRTVVPSVNIIDRGRDNLHPGPMSVKLWANQLCLTIREFV